MSSPAVSAGCLQYVSLGQSKKKGAEKNDSRQPSAEVIVLCGKYLGRWGRDVSNAKLKPTGQDRFINASGMGG